MHSDVLVIISNLEYIRLSGTFRPVTDRYSSSEISTESAVQA